MEVYIFILCYNEEVLLPHTIHHYRTYIPNCYIIIYDNYSTDESVFIAKNLGCYVIQWKSNGIDDNKYIKIKNNCWKNIKNGWVLCIDMDEWLCVTYYDLLDEYTKGTTILKIQGVNIVGDSKTTTLEDINLHSLKKGISYKLESKKLCFLLPHIKNMNYTMGAHTSAPKGVVQYSKKKYINKHMELLGELFYINKKINRNHRLNKLSLTNIFTSKLSNYYSPDAYKHKKIFEKCINKSKVLILDDTNKILKLFILFFINFVYDL